VNRSVNEKSALNFSYLSEANDKVYKSKSSCKKQAKVESAASAIYFIFLEEFSKFCLESFL